jgi:type VI secretion system secreted protein VgrG
MPASDNNSALATDENRDLEIRSPFQDDLLISHVAGAERLSQPFHFDLSLESAKSDLKSDTILGQPVNVKFLVDSDDKPHYVHGIVTDFGHTGYDGRFHQYHATLRPWFWLLTRSADCRIFEDMSLEDIFKKVAQEHGFSDLKFKLQSSPPRRMYCVQYRETAFNFLSRLLEEEGIYYYFEHTESKHTMVLVNSSASHESRPGYAAVPYYPPTLSQAQRTRDHLTSWSMTRTVQPGGYITSDFDLEADELAERQRDRGPSVRAQVRGHDFPADLQELSAGQSSRTAKIRLEELQTTHGIAHGEGTAVGLSTGAKFKLEDYPREEYNDDYLVIGTSYSLSSNPRDSGGGTAEFHVSVEAIPLKEQFRPPRVTPKPVVQGTETAIVVAGTGKDKDGADKGNGEIDADKFGRVRVKFHWDRQATSSCLVRVAQVWAGKNWGAQYVPRIGHEVIVSFLEGDPDRPIIVGSVYNGDAMPPYALPTNVTQSGIKSRSSKGGGEKNFNEIRFEDKTGSEEVVVHAEVRRT